MGEKYLNKKAKILLVVGVLVFIIGALIDITRNPLVWGTGIVTLLFTILLFRIDPLRDYTKDK
jgi:hypothetical protein